MKILTMIPALLTVLFTLGSLPAAFATGVVPFEGHLSGSSIATSQASNNITAIVYLEHLGKSHLVGTTTVTGQTKCGGFVGTERDTITAANGDEIFAFGYGVSCSTSPTVFHDNVTFTVTGGTGHFTGASGSGTVHTTIVITSETTSTFTAIIDGTISY
jgi:hypothetical protein